MNDYVEDDAIYEVPSTSPHFRAELAKKLEELVPEAVADGKIDTAKLKELLAEDADESNERFGLFWPGKKQAMRAAQEPTTATLKPAKDLSKDWDMTNNIFIEGDNLEVLKVLQKQYHNSIKMIYIDPPYNTGKDFVYPDNFKEGLQNYLEFSKQVDEGKKKTSTNTETAGRYHSNWLNMMYPRLKLARNLLTDDGVIFISIDDAEQANLKKMCDEIFGEGNFIAQFIWRKKSSGGQHAKHVLDFHEYILVYARNIDYITNFTVRRSEKQRESFKLTDKYEHIRGKYLLSPLKSWLDYRPTLIYPIVTPDGSSIETQWVCSRPTYEKLLAGGRIEFKHTSSGWSVYKKQYEKDRADGVLPPSILDFVQSADGTRELREVFVEKIFDNPKPSKLLKYFAEMLAKNDDVVLDFFAGSATTAHAIMQLNVEDGGSRKHIMVQLPEPTDAKSEAFKAGYKKISDIARERINRAGEKIKADFADKLAERKTPLDVGYRTYKLADTNFTKWKSTPTDSLTELQARLDLMRESSNDDASEEDLLVEVLLKMGLPLTTRTKTVDVDGLHVHQVVTEGNSSEGQPVLYLNEHTKPTLDQLRAIITDLTPSKFVILDDALQGDNQLKTNLVQTCKSYDVELWTV